MADSHSGADDGASSSELRQQALDQAVMHLVGESRSWLQLVQQYADEIGSLHDERAARLVEALGLTLAETAPPGTLRHLERAASELLRSLGDLRATLRAR